MGSNCAPQSPGIFLEGSQRLWLGIETGVGRERGMRTEIGIGMGTRIGMGKGIGMGYMVAEGLELECIGLC